MFVSLVQYVIISTNNSIVINNSPYFVQRPVPCSVQKYQSQYTVVRLQEKTNIIIIHTIKVLKVGNVDWTQIQLVAQVPSQ